MRRIGALVIAAVTIAGCGTVTGAHAVRDWVQQSSFHVNSRTLIGEVTHARSALMDATSSAAALHTVCAVLLTDTQAANESLPTPDDQATKLLGVAYRDLGSGANTCYGASGQPQKRRAALSYLKEGAAQLSFATLRLSVAATGP